MKSSSPVDAAVAAPAAVPVDAASAAAEAPAGVSTENPVVTGNARPDSASHWGLTVTANSVPPCPVTSWYSRPAAAGMTSSGVPAADRKSIAPSASATGLRPVRASEKVQPPGAPAPSSVNDSVTPAAVACCARSVSGSTPG